MGEHVIRTALFLFSQISILSNFAANFLERDCNATQIFRPPLLTVGDCVYRLRWYAFALQVCLVSFRRPHDYSETWRIAKVTMSLNISILFCFHFCSAHPLCLSLSCARFVPFTPPPISMSLFFLFVSLLQWEKDWIVGKGEMTVRKRRHWEWQGEHCSRHMTTIMYRREIERMIMTAVSTYYVGREAVFSTSLVLWCIVIVFRVFLRLNISIERSRTKKK